jgi:hypothetical protein
MNHQSDLLAGMDKKGDGEMVLTPSTNPVPVVHFVVYTKSLSIVPA